MGRACIWYPEIAKYAQIQSCYLRDKSGDKELKREGGGRERERMRVRGRDEA